MGLGPRGRLLRSGGPDRRRRGCGGVGSVDRIHRVVRGQSHGPLPRVEQIPRTASASPVQHRSNRRARTDSSRDFMVSRTAADPKRAGCPEQLTPAGQLRAGLQSGHLESPRISGFPANPMRDSCRV
ncbi:hypothetical protein FRUB_03308 [Fimbriiglobus ruber]|uniref:Uncharacterized protein n=1 Tax=Fimbriiglobus ruber TaxID=1908690 RepID=A0A225E2J4_9BACT|nr:hypothetical protein FRUB_03308 [Fimbriiglobus ruber]